MKAFERFLEATAGGSAALSEDALSPSAEGWAASQVMYLDALDRFIDGVKQLPADYEISSHEAGGHCRPLIVQYQVRGGEALVRTMRTVFEARRQWVAQNLYHGYVACDEIHHEPETFLYFQVPFMHLIRDSAVVEAVEDFAHHVGNWVDGVPPWYDWETHGFRSTWLGTKEIRSYPPFDYQEANHFRFVSVCLAAYLHTGKERYRELAEDYANRWCDHIENCAATGEPIACSILPHGIRRKEVGSRVPTTADSEEHVYPVFYETVAPNTASEIALSLLDLYRLTGRERYRTCARLMIGQFYDHIDPDGRPASHFTEGEWKSLPPTEPGDLLRLALSGQNHLLVRVTEKYRAVTGDTCFDASIMRWAESVDESARIEDQLHIGLLAAAHRISGESDYLSRAYRMGLRGMAATQGNGTWHLCSGVTRHGFTTLTEPLFDTILAGAGYALRGGLPMVGLAYHTGTERGLPHDVAVRSWETTPPHVSVEMMNTGKAGVRFQLSSEGSGGLLSVSGIDAGDGTIDRRDGRWSVSLPAGARLTLHGRLLERSKLTQIPGG